MTYQYDALSLQWVQVNNSVSDVGHNYFQFSFFLTHCTDIAPGRGASPRQRQSVNRLGKLGFVEKHVGQPLLGRKFVKQRFRIPILRAFEDNLFDDI